MHKWSNFFCCGCCPSKKSKNSINSNTNNDEDPVRLKPITSEHRFSSEVYSKLRGLIDEEFARPDPPFRTTSSEVRKGINECLDQHSKVKIYKEQIAQILPESAIQSKSQWNLNPTPLPASPKKISKLDDTKNSSHSLTDVELNQQYYNFLDAFFSLKAPKIVRDLFSYIYNKAWETHNTEEDRRYASFFTAFWACYLVGILKPDANTIYHQSIIKCIFINIFNHTLQIQRTSSDNTHENSTRKDSSHELWERFCDNSRYDPNNKGWEQTKPLVEEFLANLCPQIFRTATDVETESSLCTQSFEESPDVQTESSLERKHIRS